MNHLLHQISWHQYLTVALVATIIYYVLIILRNYRPELKKLHNRLTGDNQDTRIQALHYQGEEAEETPASPIPEPAGQQHHEEEVTDTDILAGKLKVVIAKAADKPFAPAVLISQLKIILKEHQQISASDRALINSLVVTECEKTGATLLTEEEVDQWWRI